MPQASGIEEDEFSDSEPFPTWRIAGMILSACVFGFALYRLLGTSQDSSWLHRFFYGP